VVKRDVKEFQEGQKKGEQAHGGKVREEVGTVMRGGRRTGKLTVPQSSTDSSKKAQSAWTEAP